MIDLAPLRHLYPFDSHWLALPDGTQLHYLDEGPHDGSTDAPPVLMLHGNPTWSFYYRDLVAPLAATHRIIAPDHVGCGLSDKPQDYPYTLEQHIRNVETLVEQLGLDQHPDGLTLVLHDWGGLIGMGYATRHPDVATRFVIFNTAAFYIPTLPKRILMCRIPLFGDVLVRGLNGFARLATFVATSQPRLPRDVAQGYLAPYDSWQNRVAIHRFVQDIPLEENHPSRPTLDEIDQRLHSLADRPMLIFWGDDDFCFTTRDFLPEWQRRFPEAEVHLLPNAGHYVLEDATEEIVPRVLNFVAGR